MNSSPGSDQPDPDANIENPILWLPCSGKGPSAYPVTQTLLDAWREAYPGIDALAEAKRLRMWLEQSPHKLRDARRMGSLISTWLANAQAKAEKGNSAPIREENPSQRSAADQDFLDRLEMSHRQEDAQ